MAALTLLYHTRMCILCNITRNTYDVLVLFYSIVDTFAFVSVWADTGDFRDASHNHHNATVDHNQVSSFLHVRNNRMRDRKREYPPSTIHHSPFTIHRRPLSSVHYPPI